jgi:prepilin-type processing-associated H-X9-DG protein
MLSKKGLKGWELAIIIALVAAAGLLFLPAFARAREASNRAACQSNLKQIGLMMKMYSSENNGWWPALSPYPENWTLNTDLMIPDYGHDPMVFACPGSPFLSDSTFRVRGIGYESEAPYPECVSSLYYTYTGFDLRNTLDAAGLIESVSRRPLSGQIATSLKATLPADPYLTDGQLEHDAGRSRSGAPMMWDRVAQDPQDFSHRKRLGGNVLYFDGHVEFRRYPDKYFPMVPGVAEAFGSVHPGVPPECVP